MTYRSIPLVDLGTQHAELREAIDTAICGVLDSGRFILGPQVSEFEQELATCCNSAHAIGVSSGTDALLLTLMALGVKAGDEVVTTPFSFFATAGVIARLGATPVFADIEAHSFNLDPQAAQSAISKRTRAILPVNLYGRLATMPACDLPVVEDAAQSIGCGAPRSVAACYSFFPTKNLGALGDAGAVVTNDHAFADTLGLLRTHGGRPKYFHAVVGGNFRIDALQAAVLRVKLGHLASWNQQRRDNAARYSELFALSKISGLQIPSDSPEHVYHQYTIRVANRGALRDYLKERGITTEVYYPHPLHLQGCFSHLGYKVGSLPVAESACKEVLSLPIHQYLSEDDQSYIVEAISSYYRR